jgi:hypothetical protein
MNKQEDTNKKTTYHNINNSTIIHSFTRSKTYYPIRVKYRLNYNCITFLLGCYIYSKYINETFTANKVYRFIGYYQYHISVRYLGLLVSNDLLNLSGKYYSITQAGYSAIEEISNTNDKVLYQFCDKYNIVL